MKIFYKCLIVATAVAGMTALAPLSQAQVVDEKISVTFSSPVEVPGKVLPAGTYVFEAMGGGTVTRIMSADEMHIFASVMTVPKEQPEQMEQSNPVVLEKAVGGNPPRVDSWFLPGNSVGCELIYPKAHSQKPVSMMWRGTEDAARDAAKPPEVVAVGVAHVGAHVGSAVFHAGKFLVT